MMSKRLAMAVLLSVLSLTAIGCNNDDDAQESIIFVNQSGIDAVSCYIDTVLQGTVDDGATLSVVGDFEGDRVLSAEGDGYAWAPTTVTLSDDMDYRFVLTK